jgi:hypothetical protein
MLCATVGSSQAPQRHVGFSRIIPILFLSHLHENFGSAAALYLPFLLFLHGVSEKRLQWLFFIGEDERHYIDCQL